MKYWNQNVPDVQEGDAQAQNQEAMQKKVVKYRKLFMRRALFKLKNSVANS